jgi:hypothetical protein
VNLLRSDDWSLELRTRKTQLDTELELTSEQKAQQKRLEIDQKVAASGRDKKMSESEYQKLLTNISKKDIALKQELDEINTCLQEGKYKIGITPFNDINTAQILLANIHLYEQNQGLNSDAVNAVKTMLSENYIDLYDDEINNLITKGVPWVQQISDQNLLTKFFANQEITLEDLVGSEEIPPEYMDVMNNTLKSFKYLDRDLAQEVYKLLEPAMSLYSSSGYSIFSALTTLLAYFSSLEEVKNYLINEVDLSSCEDIESTLMSQNIFDLSILSKDEKVLWGKLNNKFGKESIKLFYLAADIQKSINIVQLHENGKTLEQLLELIKEKAKTITFKHETTETKNLADLCRKYNLSEAEFNKIIQEILPQQKAHDNLPDIKFTLKINKEDYTFAKLIPGDARSFFLGKMTNCCQFIGGDSEQCVIDGFTREDAGFYIITDKKGGVKAQMYAWIGLNDSGEEVLMLDSFEHLTEGKKLAIPFLKKLNEELANTDFKALHVGTGGKTPHFATANDFKITPKNEGLFQYRDSTQSYKIDDNIKLALHLKYTSPKKFDNLEDYTKYSPMLALKYIKNTFGEYIFKALENDKANYFATNSVINAVLLEKEYCTITELCEYYQNIAYVPYYSMMPCHFSIIDEMIKSKTPLDDFFKLASMFTKIHPIIIDSIEPEIIIDFCQKVETIPYQINAYNFKQENLSQTKLAMQLAIKQNDISIFEKIIQIHPIIIDSIEPEIIIDFCQKAKIIPYQIHACNFKQENLSQIKLAMQLAIKHNDISIFDKIIQIHPIIIESVDPEIIIDFCQKVETIPYQINAYNFKQENLSQTKLAMLSVIKQNDILIFEKIMQIHPIIIDSIEPEIIIDFCQKAEIIPYQITSYFLNAKDIGDFQHCAEIITDFINRHLDDIDSAMAILGNTYDIDILSIN